MRIWSSSGEGEGRGLDSCGHLVRRVGSSGGLFWFVTHYSEVFDSVQHGGLDLGRHFDVMVSWRRC